MFDYLIIGAGFSGSILAERLARDAHQRVLLVDRRNHIGGNAYDHYNEHGILVHRYGPHIFHTNSKEIFDYLSNFTEWRSYQHRVLACVDGQLVPIPINLDTINTLYGLDLTSFQMKDFLASLAEMSLSMQWAGNCMKSFLGATLANSGALIHRSLMPR
jgi:UDP-galactopyranose mutase